MSDQTTPRQRHGTWDRYILESVISQSEYGKIDFHERTVIDVGAHIGAFTMLAVRNGARRVLAVEAGRENFAMLQANCSTYPNVECRHGAVWGNEEKYIPLNWRPNANSENTGGGSVVPCTTVAGFELARDRVETVRRIPLDELIEELGGVDLLKIDAEGSEYPILLGCQRLDRIGKIVGEYHTLRNTPTAGGQDWTIDNLVRRLQAQGFIIERELHPENGIFRAFRPNSRAGA